MGCAITHLTRALRTIRRASTRTLAHQAPQLGISLAARERPSLFQSFDRYQCRNSRTHLPAEKSVHAIVNVHEHVRPAIIGLDESKASIDIEKLHYTAWHSYSPICAGYSLPQACRRSSVSTAGDELAPGRVACTTRQAEDFLLRFTLDKGPHANQRSDQLWGP